MGPFLLVICNACYDQDIIIIKDAVIFHQDEIMYV